MSVGTANKALVRLGADRIDSFGDDSTESIVMSELYTQCKQEVLRSYEWNCATRRVELTVDTESPVNGFDNQFVLPDDCLRVVDVFIGTSRLRPEREYDGNRAYSVEGPHLLANHDDCSIVYIADVPESSIDIHVEMAIVAKLCLEAAYPIQGSNATQDRFEKYYRDKLEEARRTDSIENPATVLRIDTLTRVRR